MRRAARFFVLAVATIGCLATVVAVAPAAQAYGDNGTLNMWQVGLSDNCNSPTACAGQQGGFWGWVQFTQDPATGATDGDAELTGCEHTTGGGPAGAVHEKIDVTGWIIAPGHIGDPTGPAAMTFWVTGGTETDYFRGQVFTGPLTDENGNPATLANPVDSGIPSTPGHYSTSAVFGVVPPPGISAQVQVAYKPAS